MFDTIIEKYEDMVFKDINLREASRLLSQFENQLEYWESEREIAFNETQPKATSYDKERVSGGITLNKNDVYVINLEKIDRKINVLKKRINNLMNYIDKEMKLLGQEDKTTQLIIQLRDDKEYMKNNKGHKRPWWQIAQHDGVWLSERQCQRRYDRHKSRCRTNV